MANGILSANKQTQNPNDKTQTLLYQDKQVLVTLLELSYQYYLDSSTIRGQAFLSFLQVVANSVEMVCQKLPDINQQYQSDRKQLGGYISYSVKQEVAELKPLFEVFSEIIQCAVQSFRAADYPPDSYQSFLRQFELIFTNQKIIDAGQQETVCLLMEQLRQKP